MFYGIAFPDILNSGTTDDPTTVLQRPGLPESTIPSMKVGSFLVQKQVKTNTLNAENW